MIPHSFLSPNKIISILLFQEVVKYLYVHCAYLKPIKICTEICTYHPAVFQGVYYFINSELYNYVSIIITLTLYVLKN